MNEQKMWVCGVKREILATNHKASSKGSVGNKQSKKMPCKNKTGKKSA